MRVLVTGGAGFIGSHLCDALLARSNEVMCLDNFFTGTRHNIARHLDNPAFEAIRHDVTNPIEVEADRIYNLACPASPIHYQRDPIRTVRTSVMGAINVLDLAQRLQVPVLHASTSEIYGDPQVHPQREDYYGHVNPIGPRSCYDEGKRCAETLFYDYRRMRGMDVRVARIFNTYGPRMSIDDGRVVSNLIVQALRGEPLTIFGDGSQTRSFCYVDDLVAGLIALMHGPVQDGPVNLGRPEEFTIAELAELILDLTGSASGLRTMPLPVDDPRQRCPDITRARDTLDWHPATPLRIGLTQTIAWFDAVLSGRGEATRTDGAIPPRVAG